MRRSVKFLLLSLPMFLCLPIYAQVSTDPANKDFWGLKLSHDHAAWPTPESLVADLRSLDQQTRFAALAALGITDDEAKNRTPNEVLLRYASIGTTDEKQAVIAVWMPSGDMLFGAVAARKGHAWQRIANFSCWCKYEGGDLLGDFVKVKSSPDDYFELIVHASGGGTGLYARDEVHFRYYEGELRPVFSFQDRFDECLKNPCSSIYRWFYPERFDSDAGAVFVEAHVGSSTGPPKAEGPIPELQLRNFEAPSCKTYKWNKKNFRYEAFSAGRSPCEPSLSSK